jgi:uncharacterized protein (DUF169 family)
MRLESEIVSAIGEVRLVGVAYLATPPPGVDKFAGIVPSSCSFWGLASTGEGFYTEPGDHFNCPIGSYTHSIDLPEGRSHELGQTLSLMAELGYVRMEEVPSIPRLPQTPSFIYYAPLSKLAAPPDVVIAGGRPGALMQLQEAAVRAGAASSLPLLGRPTCMALPAAMAHGSVMSSGCIGNRVYTGLGDDELYVMIPGNRLDDVVRELGVIHKANLALQEYHQQRKATLTA